MKIIEKPRKNKRIAYGFWNRRFKGFYSIGINGGTFIRRFKTVELYNLTKEMLSKSTFANPLDMRNWLERQITGFEVGITTVAMADSQQLPNGVFIPAPLMDDNFVDS